MKKIAFVVLRDVTRDFDKEYSYIIPDELLSVVEPGVRVMVPFGKNNSQKEAFVFRLSNSSSVSKLKEISKQIDDVPVISENQIKLAVWMKKRYVCTFSNAIRCMIPPGISIKNTITVELVSDCKKLSPNERKIIDLLKSSGGRLDIKEIKNASKIKNLNSLLISLGKKNVINVNEKYSTDVSDKIMKAAFLIKPDSEVVAELESGAIRSIQQIRALELLIENEFLSVADFKRYAHVSASVINTLKKNSYIDFKDIEISRDPYKEREIKRTKPLIPLPEQQKVIDSIISCLNQRSFKEFLLRGVTSSGKTEVYMQIIQHCVNEQMQAIVLVPEISLTPQMVERFKGRFGNDVAVLHSRLSMGERYDQWKQIRDQKVKIVVGARSAVFAPLKNPGIIIIDEEHESSYKSETIPKYNAKDIARQRCKNNGAVLLYGSATPSVESYYKATNGSINIFYMKERTNKSILPKINVIDMREELDNGNRSILSDMLRTEIEKNIQQGQQTMLFLNRRGHSSFVLCRNCGLVIKCKRCSISMTYHSKDQRLICHYCGYTIKNPKVCPRCKSKYIKQFGIGTQKVEEEVKKMFPDASVIRMDMDTTTGKNSHEKILNLFKNEKIDILIGTQMIAKGHDFSNVTLVGVLAADGLLYLGDYRACERTFQLLTQVAGRAGRGNISGRVVVQTYNTENFSIKAASSHNYFEFYKQEIIARKKLNYPPFVNIGIAVVNGIFDNEVYNHACEIYKRLESFSTSDGSFEVFSPARAPLVRVKNRYRWRIVMKCTDIEKLLHAMTLTSDEFYKKKKKSGVNLSIDINPNNML